MITQEGNITLPNDTALSQGARVKVASGKLALAGASDIAIGTMALRSLSTDSYGVVAPFAQPRKGIAAAAITQYAACYPGANGKLAASTGTAIGIALEAASGDGSVIDWLPYPATVA